VGDEAEGIADGVRGGGAGGGSGGIRAFGAGAHRNVAGGKVDDGGRNKERRNASRAALQIVTVFAFDDFKTTDAAADIDADAFGIFFGDLEAGGSQSIFRGGYRELDKPAHLLDFLLFDELCGVEVFDFAGNLSVKQSRIEGFDAGNAAAAFQQRLPRLYRGIADGGDEADARDYDSAGNKELSFLSLIVLSCITQFPGQPGPGRTNGFRETKSWGSPVTRPFWMPKANAGMPRGLLLFVFDVGDGVADSGDFFRVFVGNFQFESFFEGHDEFHDIQGVGAEVIDERCLVVNLALVHTQLLYDDLFDLLFYC